MAETMAVTVLPRRGRQRVQVIAAPRIAARAAPQLAFALACWPDFLDPPLWRCRLALAGDRASEAVSFLARSESEAMRVAAGWLATAFGPLGWTLDAERWTGRARNG